MFINPEAFNWCFIDITNWPIFPKRHLQTCLLDHISTGDWFYYTTTSRADGNNESEAWNARGRGPGAEAGEVGDSSPVPRPGMSGTKPTRHSPRTSPIPHTYFS